MSLTREQRTELEGLTPATVRLMLLQGGPGRGAAISGFKCGDITKGDIDDWLIEKSVSSTLFSISQSSISPLVMSPHLNPLMAAPRPGPPCKSMSRTVAGVRPSNSVRCSRVRLIFSPSVPAQQGGGLLDHGRRRHDMTDHEKRERKCNPHPR